MSTDIAERDTVTFEDIATEAEQQKVAEVEEVINVTVTAAHEIEVRNNQEAQQATEFLARLAGDKKRAETARVALVKPLNDHVKMINERFKTSAAPLAEADDIVREKVLAYRLEQERLRAAEQARLDAEHRERERVAIEERRRVEAAAQAEREAAAREAVRLDAEAKAAEQRRQAALAEQDRQLVAELSALTDEALKDAAYKPPMARARVAGQILDQRRAARQDEERAARAAALEAEARAAEQALRDAPPPEVVAAVVAPPVALATQSGSATEVKRWEHVIVDESKVPGKYRPIDEKLIRADVRAGVREIPGCLIRQVASLAVRAR